MRGCRGAIAWLLVLLLGVTAAAAAAAQLAQLASGARREAATERALARAREALLAYASGRPIDAVVGPGYLPCPDIDGDGWAEPICGSLDGDRGGAERLGLLPWKSLGLDELHDGHGAPLWYAVATRYKGLLNCAASAACIDMSPGSLRGTITVRDPDGAVTHDGTLADPSRPGAAAVVIAPGPPMARGLDGDHRQRRGRCAGRCDPRDYLEAAPGGEDNADFSDRLDGGRAANANGFIRGPVRDAAGTLHVNDRVLALGEAELRRRLMRRVALEAAHCLRLHAARPENGGRYPWPAPACGTDPTPAAGRVPEALFAATLLASGCAAAPAPSWWQSWKPYVFYAPAAAFAPGGPPPHCAAPGACIAVVDGAGEMVAAGKELVLVVGTERDACAPRALECDAAGCTRARLDPAHELLALP